MFETITQFYAAELERLLMIGQLGVIWLKAPPLWVANSIKKIQKTKDRKESGVRERGR